MKDGAHLKRKNRGAAMYSESCNAQNVMFVLPSNRHLVTPIVTARQSSYRYLSGIHWPY